MPAAPLETRNCLRFMDGFPLASSSTLYANGDGSVKWSGAGGTVARDRRCYNARRQKRGEIETMSKSVNDRSRSPRVTAMRVVPVAGRDSMLLNLSGAHGPYFTRNLVLFTDEAGQTGVGEVPGGEKIRRVLEESQGAGGGAAESAVTTQCSMRCRERFAESDRCGARRADLRFADVAIHAVTAIEAATAGSAGAVSGGCRWRRCLGEGAAAVEASTVLGYLFFVGDRTENGSAVSQRGECGRRVVAVAG